MAVLKELRLARLTRGPRVMRRPRFQSTGEQKGSSDKYDAQPSRKQTGIHLLSLRSQTCFWHSLRSHLTSTLTRRDDPAGGSFVGIYESHLTGHVMYLWGRLDEKAGLPRNARVLPNAQNGLDHLIGDLFGATAPPHANVRHRRWLLAEVKRHRVGFHQELLPSGKKPHRRLLHQKLMTNARAREIAYYGHFGIWSEDANPADSIQVLPYANAAEPGTYTGANLGAYDPRAPLPPRSFQQFWEGLHNPNMGRFTYAGSQHLYGHGAGLPAESMREYLESVIEPSVPAGQTIAAATNYVLFGFVAPGAAAPFQLTNFGSLIAAIRRVRRLAAPVKTPPNIGP